MQLLIVPMMTILFVLQDSTARRNLISNALLLVTHSSASMDPDSFFIAMQVRAARGRNLLLASEARRAIDLRSAYDVANL
jgi:hypothetical protein